MSKILFHMNTICVRGVTVAVIDYARYNKKILGNDSIIVYPLNYDSNTDGLPPDSLTNAYIVDKLKTEFEVIGYNSLSELDAICLTHNIDYAYFQKWGFNDGLITTKAKNLIHSVFQCDDFHGDKYAYISNWLSTYCSNGKHDYVPYIVTLPEYETFSYREKLGISSDKIVVGRIGGFNEFDIEIAMYAILDIVSTDPDFIFVFVNTRKFIDHPNVIYLDPIYDIQEKTNFILSCNALLHARSRGESFGLAISEFLFHNKPVFSYNGGTDLNHIEFLRDTGNLYNNREDLVSKLKLLKSEEIYNYDYKSIVAEYSPERVMKKFNDVFLA